MPNIANLGKNNTTKKQESKKSQTLMLATNPSATRVCVCVCASAAAAAHEMSFPFTFSRVFPHAWHHSLILLTHHSHRAHYPLSLLIDLILF